MPFRTCCVPSLTFLSPCTQRDPQLTPCELLPLPPCLPPLPGGIDAYYYAPGGKRCKSMIKVAEMLGLGVAPPSAPSSASKASLHAAGNLAADGGRAEGSAQQQQEQPQQPQAPTLAATRQRRHVVGWSPVAAALAAAEGGYHAPQVRSFV